MIVTCAIITSKSNFLIARRPLNKRQGGKWEFPGGKINANETPFDCIIREIQEELLLTVTPIKQLETVTHQYDDFRIDLIPFICEIISGSITLTEHSEYAWANFSNINNFNLCDADKKIVPLLIDL